MHMLKVLKLLLHIQLLKQLHNTNSFKYGFIIILLDLSAAYHTINILASIIPYIGIRDTAHGWLMTYLTYRQYKVNIKSTLYIHINQYMVSLRGYALGPILFNIYT